MAVSDQLHDQFSRVFCKHLSIDRLENPYATTVNPITMASATCSPIFKA